ncbi:MAG: succinate dehydrogenase, hydrophobic membrane anchor protein [Pseudomonadota bacterium]|nr:succinate dehydrogenase, hydrophobic membrane anchor protein [Pseudomonadota bacterium]
MGNGTSIGRVRGLGSAKHGPHHWLMQRFTAIGNLVLTTWLVISLLLMPNFQYATVHQWAARPLSATALGLLIICTFWHARLGMQVMIEDYVHDHGNKFAVIALLNLAAFAGVAFGLISVIRIALGGA